MNIYNFIYCYFYNLWKSKGGGRIDTSAHVLFAIIIHVLLLSEIIQDITGFKIVSLPDYGGHGRNKYVYFLFAIPFWGALVLFYSKERTKQLLKDYHQKYGEAGIKNTIKILLYVVAPTILLITLAVIRQRS
jgi:hypothetical protein